MFQEEKKPEEQPKAEEKKPEEEKKKEEAAAAEKPSEEKKPEQESKEEVAAPPPPPPPAEIVLKVFMHCEGCARKVRRSLKGFPGQNQFCFSVTSFFGCEQLTPLRDLTTWDVFVFWKLLFSYVV